MWQKTVQLRMAGKSERSFNYKTLAWKVFLENIQDQLQEDLLFQGNFLVIT